MRAASRKRKRCSKRGDARAKPAARPGELEAANGRKGRSVRPRRKPKPLPLSGSSGNEGSRPVDAKEASAGSNVRRGFEGGPAKASRLLSGTRSEARRSQDCDEDRSARFKKGLPSREADWRPGKWGLAATPAPITLCDGDRRFAHSQTPQPPPVRLQTCGPAGAVYSAMRRARLAVQGVEMGDRLDAARRFATRCSDRGDLLH